MLPISTTDEWRAAHRGAVIGLLELSGLDNTLPSPKLDERKRETEARLREKYRGYSRQDFLTLPVMAAYDRYYKKFTKTYHVLQQVESIALKGKKPAERLAACGLELYRRGGDTDPHRRA